MIIQHQAGELKIPDTSSTQRRFDCEHSSHSALDELGIQQRKVNPAPLPIITEGALWDALVKAGKLTETVILNNDSGQFKLGEHALSWVHTIRHLQKLPGLNTADRRAIDTKRNQIFSSACWHTKCSGI